MGRPDNTLQEPERHSSVAESRDYPPLRQVNVELTYRCPRQCTYCLQDGVAEALYGGFAAARHNELSTDEWRGLIDQAARLDTEWLNFSGGEPFLRGDLAELIAHAHRSGIKTSVPTKQCPDPDDLAMLALAGLDVLGFGLDSHLPELADWLVGEVGYFDRCMASIRAAKSIGLRVMLMPVITRRNVSYLPDFLEFAAALHVDVVRPQIYDPRPSLLQRYKRNRDPAVRARLELAHPLTVRQLIDELDSPLLETRNGASAAVSYPTHCVIGKGEMSIRPDGKVYFCPLMADLVVGDVRRETLEDIWYRGTMRAVLLPVRERYRGSLCADCGHFVECTAAGRCAGRCMLEHGSLFTADPGICRLQ